MKKEEPQPVGALKVKRYIRISTADAANDGYSIDEQLKLLNEWYKATPSQKTNSKGVN
ncbi:hypothetical protein M3610_13470 [Neobacillus sp. MER 74]|uniref:hypothetical protein n=1 Tax=Neobacillus sp. MER 74 TaxID=2939566 RepID=UPI0020407A83|nr:hypothetical protein [Neobacillus sp. MER 74]MCM3116309.1 hypothetical protein [Neobacillus sp. MER 74]